ncbi:type II secretion system protein [Candidatus Kaiserbacteria bacterium]|nr:type II secretion system protein [Candidatus Kaiserbacteria bacterium]
MRTRVTAGYTFVEILVVLAVIAILAAVTVTAFQNFYGASALKTNSQEVYMALTDARLNTLGSAGDTVYGVHLTDTGFVLFVGDTYDALDPDNQTYEYTFGITAVGTLPTVNADVVFSRLTGMPSVAGTIILRNRAQTETRTLTIYDSGLIEY